MTLVTTVSSHRGMGCRRRQSCPSSSCWTARRSVCPRCCLPLMPAVRRLSVNLDHAVHSLDDADSTEKRTTSMFKAADVRTLFTSSVASGLRANQPSERVFACERAHQGNENFAQPFVLCLFASRSPGRPMRLTIPIDRGRSRRPKPAPPISPGSNVGENLGAKVVILGGILAVPEGRWTKNDGVGCKHRVQARFQF